MAATAQSKREQPAAAISAADAKRAKKSDYIPLKIRFQAWWDGVDATKLMDRRLKAQNLRAPSVQDAVGPKINIDESINFTDASRTDFELLISIRERVWGKGLMVPGGYDS